MMFPTLTPKFFEDAGVPDLAALQKKQKDPLVMGGSSYGNTPGTCSMMEFNTPIDRAAAVEIVRRYSITNGLTGAFLCNVVDRNIAAILKSHGWIVNRYRGNHGSDVYSCFLPVREAVDKGEL
jgi:hypothetical protein